MRKRVFLSLPRLTILTLTHISLNSLFLLRTISHCCSSIHIHTVLLMLVRSHSFSSLFITRPKLTHWRRKGSAENYETWSAWMWHTTAVVQREIKSKCVAKLSCNNWKEEKNCLTFKCRVWNVHKTQSKWISTSILTFLKCTLLQGHSGEYGNKRHLGTWKN